MQKLLLIQFYSKLRKKKSTELRVHFEESTQRDFNGLHCILLSLSTAEVEGVETSTYLVFKMLNLFCFKFELIYIILSAAFYEIILYLSAVWQRDFIAFLKFVSLKICNTKRFAKAILAENYAALIVVICWSHAFW